MNLTAELKELDATFGLDKIEYDNEEIFHVNFVAQIGILGNTAADQFDFSVCSPGWLNASLRDDITSGHSLFIIKEFDLSVIKCHIEKICSKITSSNWNNILIELRKHFAWEYDNYNSSRDAL